MLPESWETAQDRPKWTEEMAHVDALESVPKDLLKQKLEYGWRGHMPRQMCGTTLPPRAGGDVQELQGGLWWPKASRSEAVQAAVGNMVHLGHPPK